MAGHQWESVLSGLLAATVAVVFIGGCTVALRGAQNSRSISECLSYDREWRDGSCVKPGAP